MKIIPAILADTKKGLQGQFDRVAELSNLISFDVADGELAYGLATPGPLDFPEVSEEQKIFWHLMVKNPVEILEMCLSYPTEIIAIHAESKGVTEVIKSLKQNDVQVGLVFNPLTQIKSYAELIKEVDLVQIMTVTPGAQGRGFDPTNLESIEAIRLIKKDVKIAVDGGLNVDTIKEVIKYNPDFLVVGSFFTKAEDPSKNYQLLRSLI